jgi:polyhydroxyalkanoate synthesis repressor PhaR
MTNQSAIELRRYPSRKLYNKSSSSYVRLPDVAELIRQGATVRVEDTETGEDVTRQVLLQIIMEQENRSDQAMLSSDLMMDMIRMNQSKASEMMTGLFEQSMAFMRAQQEQIASQVTNSFAQPWSVFDPAAMQDLQRQHQQRLASLWGQAAGPAAWTQRPPAGPEPVPPAPEAPVPGEGKSSEADELRALRARLEELEKKLDRR